MLGYAMSIENTILWIALYDENLKLATWQLVSIIFFIENQYRIQTIHPILVRFNDPSLFTKKLQQFSFKHDRI